MSCTVPPGPGTARRDSWTRCSPRSTRAPTRKSTDSGRQKVGSAWPTSRVRASSYSVTVRGSKRCTGSFDMSQSVKSGAVLSTVTDAM
jgi:hypothetical protein